MLGLRLSTDPRWANLAEKSLAEILIDHAYCEQKAATSCISLIVSYPDHKELVDTVAPIVTEEWGHFRSVLAELNKRNIAFGYPRKDEYVNELIKFQKKNNSRKDKLLEKLLTCALIEARSCERFRLLSIHLQDQYFKDFYHKFMVSEAGHYRIFINLAKHYFDENLVKNRWEEYLDFESDLLKSFELKGNRVH